MFTLCADDEDKSAAACMTPSHSEAPRAHLQGTQQSQSPERSGLLVDGVHGSPQSPSHEDARAPGMTICKEELEYFCHCPISMVQPALYVCVCGGGGGGAG